MSSSKHPNCQKLIQRVSEFLSEVENLTPGRDLERRLNREYGPGNAFYDDFARLIREGLEYNEGWVATDEVQGAYYRRTRISPPTEATRFCSITTVYMDPRAGHQDILRGQYHLHPYGEINCVIPMSDGAQLKGMSGWQGAGWTSPGPGTHHYPEARTGAVVVLFFLPAGRISYNATPGAPQPVSV
ncbi:hypothetical protein ISF_04690 [Cordyceps fumosorosea ARSEF 2679]|uniref:p-hydroxylaminobenzoate lyase n=1 Tax=Cordyceps fumosorosea (strain ARSEF 2679) TaxID=1081104 RepID=A0A167WMM6_CORFA|nr:hypothetical protein ISF_04690 [Cordyceps fumosorosea ARSEF 2679]OAA63981.1 hypothetical protein ISF_04690 [Cordyceps fumosorosea ARSEF 2679]